MIALLKSLFSLLRAYWPQIVMLLAVALIGYKFGHSAGQQAHQSELQKTITTLQTDNKRQAAQLFDYEQEKRIAAEQQVAALKKAREQEAAQRARADKLAADLLDAQTELEQTKKELKRMIPYAVTNDGTAFTGIGPDSLRLYKISLGYPADSLPGTGEAPRRAAVYPADAIRASGGLSPAGIITHAADYGEWCLTLKGKLEKLNQFYDKEAVE
ncbi:MULTISPECIES: hypothetical protein [Brenneria]|uniref:Lysis protein n=1 Tax=Brenneria nigrifluens DSM 30175 = ATCC 13028 TaxID=1121120 RepID=A0A2U1USP0_9GAMM|nr:MULTISPECIES: hypothetical protein [Brenneria]EHD21538.1 hypothetical protein BrE312_2155 [Brenneria sp. EniD312]PWC24676.1 hypothetical protein DDT54_08285 [Brenneria nigrifluens DSM 30175 = ATCC 13028]QCR04659.1 hypothetical protein EH206_11040 [Brenneria nigrifluens DSM 30175 = ATCC 13028]